MVEGQGDGVWLRVRVTTCGDGVLLRVREMGCG